ncbi:bifunctional phosphopantothenoylcysteine decarboxylase/phosphopantothenate--cysteine ligase CoaBC [Varunaivibrio sulfuroxidans]|uniref:Coenzyme A biosynthesis bifunctional protein CoaBC n=1 Tax=Varunaivibrio sulfuroxidans TaxID=1773489 RepID=A0A4R3JIK7_9PROT|nr:bifunctional phosphopantothenoylcysteine decarboxylase/phosphopantothenate--cysteine ligase CoaBC [Varunaivibrio sulfuroxidans]TCS65116.1 phosphopantothenate-cysteine ligase /phosphopantothenoylcysteine decarboxylase [Varunaivibrio sulfuroxidans]WES29597.1 bifunctional phosphopantothenoylcysteine decarboxylase/phosphopantothenate--cysteine ligase CoaBC [Varunaivibrio sulfuroxidans]
MPLSAKTGFAPLAGKRILLVVTGGIAAYKTPDLVRRLVKAGARVRCVLSRGGAQFVTAMSLAAVSGEKVHDDLFSLDDENEIGHIRLSREADVVLIAPATANIIAKLAHGLADDLPSAVLLASDKPIVIAPAMNVRMWEHPATRHNVETLTARGVRFIGPDEGDMACGEWGFGRMSDPEDIAARLHAFFGEAGRLKGRRAIVTSGPTHEPIDPVRYLANRSSGKQGHAIAAALSASGAQTTLISGPTRLADPLGVEVVHVQTAAQMAAAVEAALPADVAVLAAAVADWRVRPAVEKIKKDAGHAPPELVLEENPDILAALAQKTTGRPTLVVGFAAETRNVIENARAKRARKGCDWIVANDVSEATGVFGGDDNTVHLIRADGVETWATMRKRRIAERLAERIADALNHTPKHEG